MLQATVNRLSGLNIKSSVTLCNEEHRFFVAEQMRQIDKLGSIILEPVGRNTAPALALAALLSDEDDLLLVLAADHVIENNEAFVHAVRKLFHWQRQAILLLLVLCQRNLIQVMGI